MLHIAYWMTFQSITQYSDILQLSIADGLKELLIDHGFTRQKILRIQSSQLASILGIYYVGKIINNAAKFKKVENLEVLGKKIFFF
jgi:hypothetical protein